MDEFSIKKLYGGAIEALMLTRLNSLADVLPVPDNQEAFTDPLNRCTYIVELLERITSDQDLAIQTIFDDIRDANSANSKEIIQIQNPSQNVFTVQGKIKIVQENIKIYLGIVRKPEVNTEISFYIADPGAEDPEKMQEIVNKFVSSLKILDFGLFIS